MGDDAYDDPGRERAGRAGVSAFTRSDWAIPAALIGLLIVPMMAGVLLYDDAPGGNGLWLARLLVGSAISVSLVLGFAAIRRRDLAAHRAWMIRAYALCVAAGTQALTEVIAEALLGVDDVSKSLGATAGWVINAAIAEWIIRRPARRRTRPRLRVAAAGGRP